VATALVACGAVLRVKTNVFHVVTPRALAALGVHDGRPVVLLTDCSYYRIVVVQIAPTPGPFDHPDPARGWSVRRLGSAALPDELPALGGAPAGWTEQHAGTLTSLVQGQLYNLATYDEEGADSDPPGLDDFDFDFDDLNSLSPGHVMVGHDKEFHEVTEKKFRSGAKSAC
jgi:hypothetical protein